MAGNAITVEYQGRVAIITLNQPEKLNSLNQDQFYLLSELLREVAKHEEVTITLLIGNGRFFSSGADMSDLGTFMSKAGRKDVLTGSLLNNINLTRAFYTHPKILVVALNGPVVGFLAALVSFADYIYAQPQTFLLLPFSSLGLAAEGGASRALRDRLGVSKAKEALLLSRRIPSNELLACGFVNKIIEPISSTSDEVELKSATFLEKVMTELDRDFGSHLNDSSLLDIKAQFCRDDINTFGHVTVQEAYTAVEKITAGVPQDHMKKVAKSRKSKL
ncbi:putative peroxisomal d3,d2-enoyl-CoA isomerase [Trichoderma chlorosporum]